MPLSVRLKPEVEQLLDAASRRDRKSRSTLVNDALSAFLKPQRPRLGAAIRSALSTAPGGFGIQREQPENTEKRNWKR